MNPAKAAPSAPVKKNAREDPQILPGGLLPFFNERSPLQTGGKLYEIFC